MLTRAKRTGDEKIGEIVKKARISKGLTIKQLAERSGVNPTTISRVENDKRRPSIDAYFKLLDALGADIYIMHD